MTSRKAGYGVGLGLEKLKIGVTSFMNAPKLALKRKNKTTILKNFLSEFGKLFCPNLARVNVNDEW